MASVSNFPSSVNYEFHSLLRGEPDWLRLSHVLTAIQSVITRRMRSCPTINAAMVNPERYPYMWGGWACHGSPWVPVSFVFALETLEEDSRVSNEDMSGGRSESQSPKAMPGSRVLEVSGF